MWDSIRKKWFVEILFLMFILFGLIIGFRQEKKLKSFPIQRSQVIFSTVEEEQTHSTSVLGLENRAFETLLKRINKRGLVPKNLWISGIILIEEPATYFFSLNANRSAFLSMDGNEISRSSIFEKELNRIVPLFLERGIHTFRIQFTPSTQGAYLHLLWKRGIQRDFQNIPSDVVFAPDAADLTLEELTKIQSNTKTIGFWKNNAFLLALISLFVCIFFLLRLFRGGKLFPAIQWEGKQPLLARLTEIDKTKGLAGLLMIMAHIDGARVFPFGTFGAAVFFFCSGMNTIIFMERVKEKRNYNLYFLFFVFLLFFGGFTQIVIAHPEIRRIIPEFLQMSALSILLILILSKLFKNPRFVGFLFPFPFIFHLIFQKGLLPLQNTWPDFMSFLFGSAAFPLFPWSGFFLFGVFMHYFSRKKGHLFLITFLLGTLSVFSVFVFKISVDKFNMTLSYVCLCLFVCSALFSMFSLFSSERFENRLRGFFFPLEVVGRNSLMFLYVHYFVLQFIAIKSLSGYPVIMLLLATLLSYGLCSLFVFYYDRIKGDMSLFMPTLFFFILVLVLHYGGYLSVMTDLRLVKILIGISFAFLYVQLRQILRVFLK